MPLQFHNSLADLGTLDAELTVLLLAARYVAKKQKLYARSDRLRALLNAARATVEDLPGGGVRWKLN